MAPSNLFFSCHPASYWESFHTFLSNQCLYKRLCIHCVTAQNTVKLLLYRRWRLLTKLSNLSPLKSAYFNVDTSRLVHTSLSCLRTSLAQPGAQSYVSPRPYSYTSVKIRTGEAQEVIRWANVCWLSSLVLLMHHVRKTTVNKEQNSLKICSRVKPK